MVSSKYIPRKVLWNSSQVKALHYHDTSEDGSNFECMLVNTVRDNFEGHTKHNIAKAKEA